MFGLVTCTKLRSQNEWQFIIYIIVAVHNVTTFNYTIVASVPCDVGRGRGGKGRTEGVGAAVVEDGSFML